MSEVVQPSRRSRREVLTQALWLSLTAVLGQITLAATVSLAALSLFAILAHGVAEGATNTFDSSVVHAIHARVPVSLHLAILSITFLANGPTIAVVLAGSVLLLMLSGRIWPDAGVLLLTGFGGYAFVEIVKALFHRPRPDLAMGVTGYSFPSGHSFLSTAVYGMLAYYLGLHLDRPGRLFTWITSAMIILLIGSSRVLLGVHYPSDVLAGFASGAAWLWVCFSLRRVFAKRNWRDWQSERLSRLAAAHRILDGLQDEREALDLLFSRIARDPSAGIGPHALARSGRTSGGAVRALGRHWSSLRRHPYDLVIEGAFLRAALKLLPKNAGNYQELIEHLRTPLRQLWTVQRGLFGLKADEPYLAPASGQIAEG